MWISRLICLYFTQIIQYLLENVPNLILLKILLLVKFKYDYWLYTKESSIKTEIKAIDLFQYSKSSLKTLEQREAEYAEARERILGKEPFPAAATGNQPPIKQQTNKNKNQKKPVNGVGTAQTFTPQEQQPKKGRAIYCAFWSFRCALIFR